MLKSIRIFLTITILNRDPRRSLHAAAFGLDLQRKLREQHVLSTIKTNPIFSHTKFSSFLFSTLPTRQQEEPNPVVSSPSTDTTAAINATAKFIQEAEFLRQRAKQLQAEAKALEASLSDNRYTKRKVQDSVLDEMIEMLASVNNNNNNSNETTLPTAQLLANIIQKERWSPEQVLKVTDRLHERQSAARNSRSLVIGKSTFQIGDTRNAAANETEWIRLDRLIDGLIAAASILDEQVASTTTTTGQEQPSPSSSASTFGNRARWGRGGRVANSLKSRINEVRRSDEQAFQRKLALDINTAVKNSNQSVEDYVRKTLGLPTLANQSDAKREFNLTRVLEKVAMIPRWVPSSLLPFILAAKTRLDPADIKAVKDTVLTGSKFYCTATESIPTAALFRGNIRTGVAVTKGRQLNATELRIQSSSVFADVQQRLEAQKDLASRVQLFFLQDPDWRPGQDEREQTPAPVILVLSKAVVPDETMLKQRTMSKWGKRISGVLAFLGTASYSVASFALNSNFLDSVVNKQNVNVLTSSLPVLIGIIAVQAIHEVAHYLVAKKRGIQIGTPIPLPSFEIGTFGCITPLRSFPSTRSDMLDFALSGPVAAMLLSIVLMVFGIDATLHASGLELAQFPVVPVGLLKSSFLTGSLLTFLAPKTMLLPTAQPIPVHPSVMIGFSGLLASALNLLPIFRLDGGRAAAAVFGPKFSGISSAFTLLMMLSLALSGSNLAFSWGILVFVFQRRPEIPIRDEVTDVDDVRLGAWLAALAAAILTLLPFPGATSFL